MRVRLSLMTLRLEREVFLGGAAPLRESALRSAVEALLNRELLDHAKL
jgi:hypothetical protein